MIKIAKTMKYFILTLLLLFNINILFSQNNSEIDKTINTCQKAIDAGKKAVTANKFDEAINYFFAAEAYDPKRRKEVKGLIDDVFNQIQDLKREALLAEEKARDALILAEEQTKVAEKQTKLAKEKTKEAEKQTQLAKEQKILAEEQTKLAKAKTEETKQANKDTEKALIRVRKEREEVKKQKNAAELLRIEALSTTTALKSVSMQKEYQDTIKGLLAIEAFNMQKTMLEDSTKEDKTWLAPEIYTALHDAVIKIEGRHYDEFPKADTGHIGAVRAIFQITEKTLYSCGSDGKVLFWEIENWKENGKPDLKRVVTVRQEREIITSAAIHIDEKNGKELIALGGQFSTVELIESKDDIIKDTKLKKAHKSQSFDYQKLYQEAINNVYDLEFKEHLLYTLGKDLSIKVYNTETGEAKTLAVLKEKAEHLAIHPDGNMIAVGYETGGIDLFDINKLGEPLYRLQFERKELKGKKITALAFDVNQKELAFGTKDGYIAIVPMIDNAYYIDKVMVRKVHSFLVSAIAFKTSTNSEGKETSIMAVGNYDGTVSIWILSEFNNKLYLPFIFDDNNTFVTSLKLIDTPSMPNHNQLMVGYFDGTIKFWNMDIGSLANSLQCILKSNFNKTEITKKERSDHYLDLQGFTKKYFAECN